MSKVDSTATGQPAPLFLYVPVARLVLLSIASLGVYEIYWVYKNWQFIKQRRAEDIWPFWRAVFAVVWCKDLLQEIHDDPEARAIRPASFSPGLLATGFILLSAVGGAVLKSR